MMPYAKHLPRCFCPERCGSTFITIDGFQQHVARQHGTRMLWPAAAIKQYAYENKNQYIVSAAQVLKALKAAKEQAKKAG